MTKSLISGVAAAVGLLAAGAASAADLPARRGFVPAPVLMAPAFMWSGFYAGLNAGYSFNSDKASTVGTPGFVGLGANVPASLAIGKNGFTGGGQIGYNYQMGNLVLGVETDLQYVAGKGSQSFAGVAPPITTSASRDNGYLGTLRARVGLVASERLMIYATGGLAYGAFQTDLQVTTAAGPAGPFWSGRSNSTRVGYTVGAGAEYALTNNWTAKLEYLYYDLGRNTVRTTPNAAAAGAFPGVAYDARVENTGQIVRAGMNYKF
jgi:outer membrane immunogenic protein